MSPPALSHVGPGPARTILIDCAPEIILIDRAPEIMPAAADLHEHVVQVAAATKLRLATPKLIGKSLGEFAELKHDELSLS
jgi:hypothetical protein